MPIQYSTDTLTFGGDVKLDQINEVLAVRGHGRPLENPRTAGDRLVATVPGGQAETVLGRIVEAGAAGDVQRVPLLHSGTIKLFGRDIPHAAFEAAETDGTGAPEPPPWQPQPAGTRRPVIALLDTGVRAHDWLPDAPADDPFLLNAEDTALPVPWDPRSTRATDDNTQAGHATFIAGLIRLAAPTARVLSVRVMGDDGLIEESDVIRALTWLRQDYRGDERPVDVVCMAFGRRPGDTGDEPTLAALQDAVNAAAQDGIRLVASAGNTRSDEEIFPAAWEVVTAVGAGADRDHPAEFSAFGAWVDEFRPGEDVLSILPGDRWATWKGTSFAAGTFAGELARSDVD